MPVPSRAPARGRHASRAAARAAPPLGAHVSVAGGLPTAFARAAELGCEAIQIFVKNASQWRGRPLAEDEVAAFRAARAASAVGAVVAHGSYLINLAASDPLVAARSREALADELARCVRLGVDALVVHPGAHLGAGVKAGTARVAAALEAVLAAAPAAPTRLLLENTAGQGSCIGARLEELAAIRAGLRARTARRVGVCIDTCHCFAAGYPVHQPSGWDELLSELDRLGLLAALDCIHVNDSLRPFASRRDRHAHIGEGEIGRPAFARLLALAELRRVPMIVETDPEGKEMRGLRGDLSTLRQLAPGASSPGAPAPVRSRATARKAGASSGRSRRPPPSASG